MDPSRSREALLEFLDYCKDKGLLKGGTAESRKAAVNQVLGILSAPEAEDVATVDLDVVMRRFQNLHGNRYTPDSLRTYRARVKNSIYDFLRFRENPMDFKPTVSAAKVMAKQKAVPLAKAKAVEHDVPKVSGAPFTTSATLPIPIREDLTVFIHGLPFDLNAIEARKVANVVLAMAGLPGVGPMI